MEFVPYAIDSYIIYLGNVFVAAKLKQSRYLISKVFSNACTSNYETFVRRLVFYLFDRSFNSYLRQKCISVQRIGIENCIGERRSQFCDLVAGFPLRRTTVLIHSIVSRIVFFTRSNFPFPPTVTR